MGQLQMTEGEFWDVEPRAFFNAVEGFESLRHMDLEIARLQTLHIVNSWGAKIEDSRQLWTYPWEKKIVTKEQIEQQRKQAQKAIERYG